MAEANRAMSQIDAPIASHQTMTTAMPSLADGITLENNIYFRAGKYDPTTSGGLGLLAHELVHVEQFEGGMTRMDYYDSSPLGYDPNSKYEQPANDMQNRVTDSGCRCTE
jgi:Domain of unknown function (DUF4157)